VSRLSELLARFGGETISAHGERDPEVHSVALDSREVEDGTLFAALPGTARDGAEFVKTAIEAGARAVLTTPAQVAAITESGELGVPLWVHPEAREVVGHAAAMVAGHPSHSLRVIAITGTNGKTSVAHLTSQLLEAGEVSTAELGTVGYRLAGNRTLPATHTTPGAPSLQRLFADHLGFGGQAVVLEASSHALDQERLAGTEVDIAVFTNLTRDHLDYHSDMDRYAEAKERLFAMLTEKGTAVVKLDDPYSARMAKVARERGAKVVSYGVSYGADAGADLCATRMTVERGGTRFTLEGMGIPVSEVCVPLFGRFNVENALAATAAALLSGVSVSTVLETLARIQPAPGRLEEVGRGSRDFSIVVDYAHTENALEEVLCSLREVLSARDRGRLVCVFGCGGDRDRGKRDAMGRAVGRLADVAIVTSDNPRTEAPEKIVEEVWAGLTCVEGPRGQRAELHSETDRRSAIELAIDLALPDDVVLIAGKGHETTQEVNGVLLPFDDRQVALEVLL